MSIWDLLFGDDDDAAASPAMDLTTTNPATGLPMIDGQIEGLDVGGSPYGMDLHSFETDWTPCCSDFGDISCGNSGDLTG